MKRKSRSLKSEVRFSLLLGLLLAVVILVSNGITATTLIKKETAHQYRNVLSERVQGLDTDIRKDSDTLIMFLQNNNNALSMASATDHDTYYLSMRRALNDLDTILRNGVAEKGFFIKEIHGERYCNLVSVVRTSGRENEAVERFVRSLSMEEAAAMSGWVLRQLDEQWYLIHVVRRGSLAVGCCVRAEIMLQKLDFDDSGQNLLALPDDEGGIAVSKGEIDPEITVDQLPSVMKGSELVRKGILAVRADSRLLNRSIYYVRRSSFSFNLQMILIVSWITAFLLSLLYFLTYIRLSGKINLSLAGLKVRINDVREGRITEQEPPDGGTPTEFIETYELFDQMVGEIRDLKISSYEMELQKRLFEIQFLSLQIEPHFYLNSMKYLYALAETGQSEVLQEIVLKLSEYFRYITYDSQKLVPVREELHHAENYLDIVRSGIVNHIEAVVEASPEVMQIPVPKLLIQTFIENAVKYGTPDNGNLTITIRMDRIQSEEGTWLSLLVQDDGNGFSEAYVRAIEENGFTDKGGHIGLYNLFHRLELLYGESIYMSVRNAESGGAVVEVMIPAEGAVVKNGERDEHFAG